MPPADTPPSRATTSRSRAQNRQVMESEILRLGREHLRTHGAAGLSLRAIARELGVVSSAVYRYVPSRDELLTLLLVEGYTDLGEAVDAAADAAEPADSYVRILAVANAIRSWAINDPARWALLYGSPVPGYAAPADRTVAPGTRVIARLLAELADAHAAGRTTDRRTSLPAELSTDLDAIRTEFASTLPDGVLLAGTLLWSTVIGATSLEVFGQYGTDTFAAPEQLFGAQVDAVLSAILRRDRPTPDPRVLPDHAE
ncbi:TetR/AcrR family transcriptional regulator [Gordonia oleivorans]|uniref:TetR/AcrR family transcriptional regulator n=1 Tax=Gordonia oleivorans TaxID=3156618 RepID=UPI003CCDDB84